MILDWLKIIKTSKDCVGLAEQNPHRPWPLKVLHKLLEDTEISFVALSKWKLDSIANQDLIFMVCQRETNRLMIHDNNTECIMLSMHDWNLLIKYI